MTFTDFIDGIKDERLLIILIIAFSLAIGFTIGIWIK
jgi:hypothetical protein